MANKLTPVDVYQIVNAAAKQMYGADTALVASDTTSFVTVGEAMLRTGYENTLNALSYPMGRLYIAVRPYRHRFDLITMDDSLFGTISRKISYFTKLFEASGNWNTDLNAQQLKDGQSIDHYTINKSYPLEIMLRLHLLHGGLRQTVDPGHELSVRGCLRPLHIARRVGEILQIRNGAGLLRVLSVVDHISEVAGNVPQLRCRHQHTSSGSIVKALCRAAMDSSSRRASSALPS